MTATACGCGRTCEPSKPVPGPKLEDVPRVDTRLSWRDRLGGWRVRWGIGRTKYRVAPGLYRVGLPSAAAPVFVTANYKLSFDTLRAALEGQDAWLLVLDTRGINVWCAAGKGTFGTEELARRVKDVGLQRYVNHRTLIVPQLGATGIAAHAVKQAAGFKVVYGPVRARDITAFMAAGMKATPAMRRVRFGAWERLVVAPVEIVATLKPYLLILAGMTLLDIFANQGRTRRLIWDLAAITLAFVVSCILVPLLLPWLPSRVFSLKGAFLGSLSAGVWWVMSGAGWMDGLAMLLLITAATAYKALLFTGSTTFTSLSGVKAEMRYATPAIAVTAGMGVLAKILATMLHV